MQWHVFVCLICLHGLGCLWTKNFRLPVSAMSLMQLMKKIEQMNMYPKFLVTNLIDMCRYA